MRRQRPIHRCKGIWRGSWGTVPFCCVVSVLAGCASPAKDSGGISIAVTSQALRYTDIATVEATITGTGIPRPIVLPLGLNGNLWQAEVVGIPAGVGRAISAVARDSAGATLFFGQTTGVTINAGEKITVAIVLYEISPPSFSNTAPSIDALTVSAARAEPNGTIQVGVQAHDPDAEDILAYHLSASCGTFLDPESASTVWTAPAAAASCTLTATVTDGRGASVHAVVTIEVSPSTRGGAIINAGPDLVPIISSITLAPTPLVVGQPVRLNVVATHPDGQMLSYLWSTDCTGTFDDVHLANPGFTLLVAPAAGTCRFAVLVTDWLGGQTTGVLNQTTETPVIEQAPMILVSSQTQDQLDPGESVILSVRAMDPDGRAITFTWSTSDGSLDQPISDAQTSQVRFTAPSTLPAAAMHVTVLVMNAIGLSTSLVFELNRAPTIVNTSLAPLPLVVGQPVNLSVTATDAGGDSLSFAWTSTCTGSFDNPTLATSVFTLTSFPENPYCMFTVVVRNQHGGHAMTTIAGMADHLPAIGNTTLSPEEFAVGQPVALATTVTDPDGDAVTFAWSSSCQGSFDNANLRTPTFTLSIAPSVGHCSFQVTANDARGGSATASVIGQVGSPPVIASMLVSPLPLLVGQPAALSVEVADADNDPMTYRWESDCAGSFNNATTASPIFTLESVPTNHMCIFQVLVSDGRGGQDSGQTLAQAGPIFVDQAPVILASSQGWDAVDPGDSIPLSVSAYDPEGLAVRYAWSATDGALSAMVVTSDTSNSVVYWSPPAVMPNRVMHVTVTVSDPGGLSNSVTFDFVPNGLCAYASDGTTCDDGDPRTSQDTCQSRICVGR